MARPEESMAAPQSDTSPTDAPAAAPDKKPAVASDKIDLAGTALSQEQDATKEFIDTVKTNQSKQQKLYDEALAMPRPEQPVFDKPEKSPKFQGTDALHAFGSIASMVGIFGSLLTRAPITSALNASAAAMQGIKKGDIEKFDNSMTEWKANMEYVNKVNDWKQKQWDMAHDLYKDNAAMLLQHAKIIGEQTQDALMVKTAKTGDVKMLIDQQKDQRDWGQKLKEYGLQVDKFADQQRHEKVEEQNKAAEIELKRAETQDNILPPQAVKYAADRYRLTGQLPPTGFGKAGVANRNAIMTEAANQSIQEGRSASDDVVKMLATKADASSLTTLTKMTDAATAFENTALENMKIVEKLMDKGAGTSAGPVFNRWLQAGRVATGDPDVAAFNAAIQTVSTEYAKIMQGATGNQALTEGMRAEAMTLLDKFGSPDQILATFNSTLRPDMENRKASLNGQLGTIKGRIGGKASPASDDGWGITPVN